MRKLALLALFTMLTACGHKSDPNTLTVGTIAGPETELVQVAAKVAHQQYGLNVKVVEFSDYNLPNAALQDGSLDANVYQHLPYLKSSMKAHGFDLEAIGKTFIYPTGIYSKKVKSINELPNQATIAIPNDPSNESRALVLLEKAGLITLNKKDNASINDITQNPRQIKLKELDAAQLPRVLDDVDAAIINTTFAIPAGLTPSHDAIFVEGKDSPYANLIVIHRDSAKKQQLNQLVKALNSEPVKQKANDLFGEGAVAAW
jgi:D-methionine transport system substrate-binding protein